MSKLIIFQSREVDTDKIFLFVEDILRHLENEEREEYKINQYLLRMQNLFR